MYICPRCKNSDPRYIGYINGKPYCRKCIGFDGKTVSPAASESRPGSGITLSFGYRLTDAQQKIAHEVASAYLSGHDTLIHAVTGAGKTELVCQAILAALRKGNHVGFAAPRKDVIIDLFPRLQSIFRKAEVIYVIGGHSKTLIGDIILLTTHQLYRYENFFDLLIIDEIDAFPYKGEPMLQVFARKAVRGNVIMLSATPSEKDISEMKSRGKVFELFSRYHSHKLPVPVYRQAAISLKAMTALYLRRFLKSGKPAFVFAPTIAEGAKLFGFLSIMFSKGAFVCSESQDRESTINDFRSGKLIYLVTTSILERGVTFKGLQVIVCHADHGIYSKDTLIQIAGRVGRKKDEPDGNVVFIGLRRSQAISDAIGEIENCNAKKDM